MTLAFSQVLRPLAVRKITRIWLMVLASWCLWGQGIAASAPQNHSASLDISQIGGEPVSLTQHFSVLEDPSQKLTLSDVQSPALASQFSSDQPPARSLNFGVTKSAYWLRLTLDNPGDQALQRMLEIKYPRLAASLQFYHQPDATQAYHMVDTGYLKPFSQRAYKHRLYVFPLALPARSQQVFYFRFQSPIALDIPAVLWDANAFRAYERSDYMLQAAYFGMVLVMVTFNLLLFVALRDPNFLFYVAFVTMIALSFAANNGLAIEYLWGNFPTWTLTAHMVGYALSLVLLVAFMRRMVATARLTPRLDQALKVCAFVAACTPIGLAFSFALMVKPTLLVFGITGGLILATGLICAFKRDRGAVFFTMAYSVFCVAGMDSHVLDRIFEPFYTTRLGQGGSGLGLSISLNIVTGVLGGAMQVHSEPGLGTRFTLNFPLSAPDQSVA